MATNVLDLSELRAEISNEKAARPTPRWRSSDRKANKAGPHRSVFWVNPKHLDLEERLAIAPAHQHDKHWEVAGVYSGEWANNIRNGFGIQVWPNGSKYEGDWVGGKRHGKGEYYVRSKRAGRKLTKVYSGQWRDDVKAGIGVYFYADGSKYEGQWAGGTRHGHGTLLADNGDVYIGEWIEGKRCGWGRLVHANGDEHVGEWLNDLKEGQGHFFYKAQRMVYDGEWVKGVPQCGIFGPIPDDAAAAADRIPKLEVCDPDSIVAARLSAILAERASIRALPLIELGDLFNAAELDDLARLFHGSCEAGTPADDDDTITVGSLADLLNDVGLNPTETELAHTLVDLGKRESDPVSFADFVKSIYLIKERENGNAIADAGGDQ